MKKPQLHDDFECAVERKHIIFVLYLHCFAYALHIYK
jgi:hypothetical protein